MRAFFVFSFGRDAPSRRTVLHASFTLLSRVWDEPGAAFMIENTKAPWHIWAVGIAAVLFNAIGAFDYVMSKTKGSEYMEAGGMTAEQIAFIQSYPLWMNVVWPIGVWTAFAASVLVLMRRKAAFPLFVISLAAFLISQLYTDVLSNGGEILGPAMGVISVVITAELAALIWYTRTMTRLGVLR
jgi:hypothetical protein